MANEERAQAKCERLRCRKRAKSLAEIAGEARSIVSNLGDRAPVGFPRERMVRRMIMQEVKRSGPKVSWMLNKCDGRTCEEPGHSKKDLVRELTKMLVAEGHSEERQARDFSVNVEGAQGCSAN